VSTVTEIEAAIETMTAKLITNTQLLAVADREAIDLSGNGQPEHLEVDFVSPSMFKVSGLPTVVGRVFTEQEDIPNGPFLAVLSEHFWRTRLQSDPKIIGKNFALPRLWLPASAVREHGTDARRRPAIPVNVNRPGIPVIRRLCR
jgi:hypothetical protein